jgi:hypothetical protein
MHDILNKQQIDQFIHEGFVRIDHAFSSETAAAARDILWKDLDCDPHDASTWTKPVIRLGWYSQPPFVEAANTPVLHAAFNQLVGKDRWIPRGNMGSFPVRFPSTQDPGDTGWHVDTSFPGSDPHNFINWRANMKSKDRALLMLFLFSDVSEHDAPTRIRAGSHIDVARILKPEGDAGLSFMELAERLHPLPERKEALATGEAGTVYLCHPFIIHAAQPHRGKEPRFMAQPPLQLKGELDPDGTEALLTPVEQAIRFALR